MALRRVNLALIVASLVTIATAAQAAHEEPSMIHGLSKVVGGVLFELPKTVIEATANEPVIIGPIVGVLAGTSRAIQTTVAGVVEMAAAFDPWGIKSTD
ncbi:MAG: hypothetical protein HY737_05520 [Candidatus Omnitrophica bacterium]|nr:hypothetical protein [Candidatus Omnitrophota bacterium]